MVRTLPRKNKHRRCLLNLQLFTKILVLFINRQHVSLKLRDCYVHVRLGCKCDILLYFHGRSKTHSGSLETASRSKSQTVFCDPLCRYRGQEMLPLWEAAAQKKSRNGPKTVAESLALENIAEPMNVGYTTAWFMAN